MKTSRQNRRSEPAMRGMVGIAGLLSVGLLMLVTTIHTQELLTVNPVILALEK